MFISAAPTLHLSTFLSAPTPPKFPSEATGAHLYSRGCGAIRALLTSLALAPGDSVLVPTYLCGEVIDTLRGTGAGLDWYPIDDRCRFDLDDLARRVRPQTRAIYAVHYFGFPQAIGGLRELADR